MLGESCAGPLDDPPLTVQIQILINLIRCAELTPTSVILDGEKLLFGWHSDNDHSPWPDSHSREASGK
jgi:hypothetical protein